MMSFLIQVASQTCKELNELLKHVQFPFGLLLCSSCLVMRKTKTFDVFRMIKDDIFPLLFARNDVLLVSLISCQASDSGATALVKRLTVGVQA